MHTDRSIEQEQADQVRRTTGATLAARALEEVLPAIGKGYAPQAHARVAERMVRDMNANDMLEAFCNTLEAAWADKSLTAPKYVQCQLGTLVSEARAALAAARGEGRGG